MNGYLMFCLLFAAIILIGSNYSNAQTSKSKINWGEICRNPLVDSIVLEPCDTLVSPDGYFLTPEGNRILLCLLGGGIGKLLGVSDEELKTFGPVVGCGSNSVASSDYNDQDYYDQIISNIIQPVNQNAPALGNNGAKITLVEFGDYQDQYSARFHRDTKDLIVNNFVKTGMIKFLFKDFIINDLPTDELSTLAAIGSYCAAEQGKYWSYHDEVYRNSKGENTDWVSKKSLTEFAVYAGVIDIYNFSTCLDSNKYENLVVTNDNLARSVNLTSTPTFILVAEGEPPLKIEGAQPYSVFEGAIKGLQ